VTTHRLQPLVAPNSLAVVGASTRKGAVGNEVLVNLLRGSYAGSLYPVNPAHDDIMGIRCFASLDQLPEVPQQVIFAVGDQHIEAVLAEAIALGVPAATIYSSLLLVEDTQPPLKQRIEDMATEAGLLLAGANGMGIYNFREHFWGCGFDTREHTRIGGVVLLSQSGSGMSGILDCEERIDFLFAASTGQELLIGVEDYLDYTLDLPETQVVGLFLETSRQPQKLIACLEKAAQKQIPIVALKVGRTELAAELAISHSGALAGSDAAYQAVFDRHGVQRVRDMDELATALIMFSHLSVPPSDPTLRPHEASWASWGRWGGSEGGTGAWANIIRAVASSSMSRTRCTPWRSNTAW
jgi:acyl-CoA synthetase (NDP forming)